MKNQEVKEVEVIKEVEVPPAVVTEVKNVILNSNVQKTRKAIKKILKCDKRITRENLIRNL